MTLSKTIVILIIAFSFLSGPFLIYGEESSTHPGDAREVIQVEVDASIDAVWTAYTTASG